MKFWLISIVFLGSGIGGSLRYMISILLKQMKHTENSEHLATFTVNIVGSFVIGFLYTYFTKQSVDQKLSLFFLTGVLGGFTTFSSFSLDSLKLIQAGEISSSLLYMVSSVLIGLIAVTLGFKLGQIL